MKAVNIADLKAHLSGYLQQVRAGEEIVIRDRNLPVARLAPLESWGADAREIALAAQGKLLLPSEPLDHAAFWSAGGSRRAKPSRAVRKAVSQDRDERDSGLLGR